MRHRRRTVGSRRGHWQSNVWPTAALLFLSSTTTRGQSGGGGGGGGGGGAFTPIGDRVATSARKQTHHRNCALGACNAEYASCAKGLRDIWSGELASKAVTSARTQRRCAVVSSSDTLLSSNCGPAIDDHDVVLRFNFASNAPAYHGDVGRKTTVMFSHGSNFNAPGHALGELGREFQRKVDGFKAHAIGGGGGGGGSGGSRQQLPGVVIQSMCAKCRFDPSLKCAANCAVAFCIGLAGCRANGFECSTIPLDILRGSTESFARLMKGHDRGDKPSSGWVGMHWANWTCGTVDAYGFPLMSSGQHYYEVEDKQQGLAQEFDLSKHNVARENAILRKRFERDVSFWGKDQPDAASDGGGRCVKLDPTSSTATSDRPSSDLRIIADAEIAARRTAGASDDLQIACSYEPRQMVFRKGSPEPRKFSAALQCDAFTRARCRGGCIRPATLPDGSAVTLPCYSQVALRVAWKTTCAGLLRNGTGTVTGTGEI
jgi:hypothetical protein